MIIKAIRQILLDQTAITDLVDGRIRPYTIEQNETKPCIDIRVVTGGVTQQSLNGHKPGFVSYITIDCYSYDPAEADAMAAAIYKPAVLGYRGVKSNVFVHGITADGAPTQDADPDPASDKRVFVTSVDLDVYWSVT